jgi:hypothetical protein
MDKPSHVLPLWRTAEDDDHPFQHPSSLPEDQKSRSMSAPTDDKAALDPPTDGSAALADSDAKSETS